MHQDQIKFKELMHIREAKVTIKEVFSFYFGLPLSRKLFPVLSEKEEEN